MAVSKPSWLRSWLSKLNWDIFTWRVYIGDAIEGAIDWFLMYLNNALDWAYLAWNKALDAWNRAVELADSLLARINQEVIHIWNRINVWWDELREWWGAKVTWIKDLLAAASDTLRGLIDDVKRGLASLSVAWDNFKGKIPSIDEALNWFKNWGGNVISKVKDWGALKAHDIRDLLNSKVKDLEPFWRGWQDIRGKVFELFDDPQKWLLDQIEKMLARFW